ncbi:excisionase [Clostridiaceae bacterium 14S0207]|nr:excisionase [Clostridiaceae bacterium 14S0207]
MELIQEELKNIIVSAIKETRVKEKSTLTIEECTQYSGIGRDKILELAHGENDFPVFKVGKKFLINKDMLDKWLQKISEEKRIL